MEAFRESSPGIFVRHGGLSGLVAEGGYAVLSEDGRDMRTIPGLSGGFLLSDHLDFSAEEEAVLSGLPRVSVGPRVVHADQAITVLQNELDRREAGWS